ncbi:MAG: serine hydrolase [Pseudomonadota bacterium]|nr:serine hydrolase [Pseudomonadota bacterium]
MNTGLAMRTSFLLLAGVLFAGACPAGAAAPRHDISYLWDKDMQQVYAYRQQVASVLGPEVGQRLEVVQKPGLYGLIYDLPGSARDAVRIVRRHNDLLASRGLRPAGLMPARDWRVHSLSDTVPTRGARSDARSSSGESLAATDVEAAVARYIKTLRRQGRLASDERTAWSVYDFTTGEKLVTINEDTSFQAASLVKPFLALAFFHQADAGRLHYGRKSRRHMERMIQHSNNSSTNWVMRQVGGPRSVQRILKKHYGGMLQGVRIVEYIPASGRAYRNKASAHDYSRFLYALWKESLPMAGEIKRLMGLPGRDRLATGADEVPVGTKVYNKTGSTAHLCGDMGILVVPGRDGKRYAYTLIGIIEKRSRARNYTAWIQSRGDVIRGVSDIVYQSISQRHDA